MEKGAPKTNGVPRPVIKRDEPIPDWPPTSKYQFLYDLEVAESAHIEFAAIEEKRLYNNRLSSVIRHHSNRTGKQFVVRTTKLSLGVWRVE